MGNKYPTTMVDAGRQGLVFAVNTNVRPLEEKEFEKTPPMTGFSGWSSYQLNFADSEKQTGGSGNIEVNHVADVKARTNFMIPLIMEEEAKKNSSGQKSGYEALLETKISFLPNEMKEDKGSSAIALSSKYSPELMKQASENLAKAAAKGGKYADSNAKQAKALRVASAVVAGKRVFTADVNPADAAIEYNEYAGKTIAEIYAMDATKAAKFTGVLKKDGSSHYPYFEAVFRMLKEDGKDTLSALNADVSASTGAKYTIYAPVLKTPNTSKTDADGLTKAYELAVYCDPTHLPYPFRVTL